MNDSSLIFTNLGGKTGSTSCVDLSATLFPTANIFLWHMQEEGSKFPVIGHPRKYCLTDHRRSSHNSLSQLSLPCRRLSNRAILFSHAGIELGGSGKTKHAPSLISDHANRLDLAGTSEGAIPPAIHSRRNVSSMSHRTTLVFLMAARHHSGPLHAESIGRLSGRQFEDQHRIRGESPNLFTIPSRARIHEPNREA